ncbi:MAG: SAM hydrolase/SAM-dependent halogenase family protein [Promethearchaeota archaeon]
MISKKIGVIGLITDFGLRGSHYVAAMKSVIHKINPAIKTIDISHTVKPFSIIEASFILYYALEEIPPGSVIVVVVDPGVGSSRPILAVRLNTGITIIGPDNGLFSLPLKKYVYTEIYKVENTSLYNIGDDGRPKVSSTFHGRDIMAPVAAHLIGGQDLKSVGPKVNISDIKIDKEIIAPDVLQNEDIDPIFRPFLKGNTLKIDSFINEGSTLPEKDEEIEGYEKIIIKSPIEFIASILYIDEFGNIITNIHAEEFIAMVKDVFKGVPKDLRGLIGITNIGATSGGNVNGDVNRASNGTNSNSPNNPLIDNKNRGDLNNGGTEAIEPQLSESNEFYMIKYIQTFSDLSGGIFGLMEGSSRFLEIVLRNDSAERYLGVNIGDKIKLIIGEF